MRRAGDSYLLIDSLLNDVLDEVLRVRAVHERG